MKRFDCLPPALSIFYFCSKLFAHDKNAERLLVQAIAMSKMLSECYKLTEIINVIICLPGKPGSKWLDFLTVFHPEACSSVHIPVSIFCPSYIYKSVNFHPNKNVHVSMQGNDCAGPIGDYVLRHSKKNQ